MKFGINRKRLLAFGLAAALLWSDTSMVTLAQTQGGENGSEIQKQYQVEALTEPAASAESATTPEGTAGAEPSATPEGTAGAESSATPEGTAGAEPTVTPEGIAGAEPTVTPEGTAGAEPTVTPEGTAGTEPAETPETTETAEPTATPEATASIEPSVTPEPSPEELKNGVLELEGIYQEGSFSVSGGISDGTESADLNSGDTRKRAEEYIYQQALAKSTSIDVSDYQIPTDELGNFFSGIVNEHPELYDIGTSVSYSYTTSGYVVAIRLQYIDGYDDAAFQAGVSAAMSVIQTGMTDLEKAIALHDYLVLFNAYDYDNLQAKTELPSVYRAYGALVNGSAVCQGYALAYKYLCEKAGIDCYMVTSDTMNHAWNLIQLDGEFYQVDVTWDDPVYDRLGMVGHNYMFVSDSAMTSLNHKNWQVTKGSSVVNLTAEDDSYDNAYWKNVTSPMIWKDDVYYYIADSAIQKRDTATDTVSTLYNGFGRWYVPGTSSYYPGIYSGLFCLGDRLYFNNADQIFSIPISGGTTRAETEILSTATGVVYGCAYMNGKVTYVLSASSNMTGKEPVYDTDLAGGIPQIRQLDKPVFSPASESGNVTEFYRSGEVALSAEEGASIYYTTDGTIPDVNSATTKVYTAPIEVTKDITISAIAVKTGLRPSEVATEQYKVCDKISVSSYAELKQKFPVSEESGVKVITLDKEIRITDEIVIDEAVQLVAETGKEISISSGALLKIKSGGTLTLGKTAGAGGSITLTAADTISYLIENQSGGSLEIGDGVSLVNGGVLNDGSMKLTGGTISCGEYGIHHRGSELEISDGTIEKSTMYGVYLDGQNGNDSTFRMDGGSIQYSGNAGVFLSGENYTFNLNGGFIISNKNRGILNDGSGTVVISGGRVRGNIVKNKADNAKDKSGISDAGIWARYEETVTVSDSVKVSDVFGNNTGSSIPVSKVNGMLKTMTLQKGGQGSLQTTFSGEEYPAYTVADESILTVDREGNVTAKEIGTTTVTAVLGTTSKTCRVTVRELFWDKENIVMEKGSLQELTLKERRRLTTEEGSGTTEETVSEVITWKMADDDVAAVTKKRGENGVVVITAMNSGNTTVTAWVGKNTGTDKNQISVTTDIGVVLPLTGVSVSEDELTLTKGETVTLRAYATPLDATEEGSISFATEDSCLDVTDMGNGEASIEAVSAGTGTVVAQLMVGGAVRATASTQVTVYEKEAPEVAPVYVLTNHTVNLKDVALPEHFAWKENAKLTASTEKQQYIAVYTYPELGVTEEVPVDVYVGTVTGIAVEGSSLVEYGGNGELTVKPVYRGVIDENFDYEVICPSLLTASADGAASENGSISYTIQPEAGSAGKRLTLTFRGGLSGTDFSNKQKNKQWFEKKFTVSVGKEGKPLVKELTVDTASLAGDGRTVVEEADGRAVIVVDASCLKTPLAKFALKVQATGRSGADITGQAAFSYKIDRTGVASIDQKGQITCKSVGTSLITVTAKDGTGVTTQIGLEVRDYRPKMSQTALAMNLACREEVTCSLKPAQGSSFTEESFTLMRYDSKKKQYVDATGYFTWERKGDELTIAPGELLTVKPGKKETYQLSVGSKVLVGTEPKSFEGSNGNIIKITVSNTVPKVSVKQSGKLNLFYKDAAAQAVLTVNGAEIESVTWKDEAKTDFTVELKESESTAGKAVIQVGQKEGISNRKKPVNQGVLQIRLKDYGETTVEVSYKVTTEYRKPTLAWKDNPLKWMPGWDITSAETVLLDKSSKTAVDLTGMTLSIDKGYTITQQESVPGGVCIEAVGTPGRKATVVVDNDNYAEAVTVPVSFSETKPVAVLSTKSITLSTQYTVENYEPYTVTVDASEKVKDIRILSVKGTDKKTKEARSSGKLSVRTNGNQLLFGLQTVMQDGKPQTAAGGTYTFQITPQAVVETSGGTGYYDMAPVKVTVKVVDKPAAVTLSGNSKLNLLDRSGAGVLVFTPKLANTSAVIRDVKLQGAYADRFTCALDANGKLTLQAKEEAELDVKKTYPVTPVYTLSDGSVVTGSVIKIQTVYPTVKFTVAEKNITLFRSARGKQNGEKVTLGATLNGSAFAGTERITSVTSMTPGFVYEEGILYIDDAYKLPTGGSTNVTLRVTFKGQASQGAVFGYKVRVNLKE